MKLMISQSVAAKSKIANGARVAAEFDKNDWSLGTVVKATPTAYKIDFDFGETHLLKTAKVRILEVNQKKKNKNSLTYADVKDISTVAIAKAQKAADAKAEAELKAQHEIADAKLKARTLKREQERAKQRAEEYAQISKPAVKVLQQWAKFRYFDINFFAAGYPHGFWILEDKKLRLQAYLYKSVVIYALPPAKPDTTDRNAEDPEIDNIEYGKLELPYEKFSAKALQSWIEQIAAKQGFKLQYPTKPPVAPRSHGRKPEAPKAKPTQAKTGIKIAVKPTAATPMAKVKTGIKLKV